MKGEAFYLKFLTPVRTNPRTPKLSKMKNLMFFSLTVFALLFASCSTDLLETAPLQENQTVASRTSNVIEVSCEVASVEIIIEETVLTLVNFDNDISDLAIAEDQTIDLENLTTGETETFEVEVLGFEIIIEETVLTLVTPPIDFGNYEISTNQTLNFLE